MITGRSPGLADACETGGSRYSTGMKLAFELAPAQADRLRDEAKRLGLAPEDLARAALADLLSTPTTSFVPLQPGSSRRIRSYTGASPDAARPGISPG